MRARENILGQAAGANNKSPCAQVPLQFRSAFANLICNTLSLSFSRFMSLFHDRIITLTNYSQLFDLT